MFCDVPSVSLGRCPPLLGLLGVRITLLPRDVVLDSQVLGCDGHRHLDVLILESGPEGIFQLNGDELEAVGIFAWAKKMEVKGDMPIYGDMRIYRRGLAEGNSEPSVPEKVRELGHVLSSSCCYYLTFS